MYPGRFFSAAILAGTAAILWGTSGAAFADFALNLPEPATPGARDIYAIHMLTTSVVAIFSLLVFAVVGYAVYRFRKSRGFQPDQNLHKGWIGSWAWIVIPALVLGVDLTIAGSAERVLENLWNVPKDRDMMEIKVTGHQWWWEYEYLDHDLRVESRFLDQATAGDLYLRDVDNRLVLPTHTRIRFLNTSADVNHAFWVSELGFKKDAIAGYITETWAVLDREGVFRGQCAELCGTWHARMPIVVEAVSAERFEAWVNEQKLRTAEALAEATADKVWTMDDLMEKGRNLYNKNCSACHQLDGKGLAPAFPPLVAGAPFSAPEEMARPLAERGFLKDGKITLGPLDKHMDIVINGIPATAMQSWGQLNDLEIAAMVTYERNAWGNNSGEVVQPADVARARPASAAADMSENIANPEDGQE